MKTIALKTIEADGVKISYAAQIMEIVKFPQDGKSADLDEVRRSLRIMNALDGADKELVLEDADYVYLRERIISARWPIANKVILEFVDDLTKEG